MGTDFDTAKRGAVALLTVQLVQVPALDVTVFAIAVTPSLNVPTVTVNVLVTVSPAPAVTLWV